MRSIRLGVALVLGAALSWLPPALAQDAICCMELIGLNGPWFGAVRLETLRSVGMHPIQRWLEAKGPA